MSDLRTWLYSSPEAGPYRAELRGQGIDKPELDSMSDAEIEDLLLMVLLESPEVSA